MTWTRRDFLRTSAAFGAAATAGPLLASRALADFTHVRSDKRLANPPKGAVEIGVAWTQPVGWEKWVEKNE
jgi:hypothetical protein